VIQDYDDYYELDKPVASGCYCRINFVCGECKSSYN